MDYKHEKWELFWYHFMLFTETPHDLMIQKSK
jgi:hypothetical protein